MARTATVHQLDPKRRAAPRSNLSKIEAGKDKRKHGYRDYDPDIEAVVGFINESGMSSGDIVKKVYELSGHAWMPAWATVDNLITGKTRRPQNMTMVWIAYAVGWERKWVKIG